MTLKLRIRRELDKTNSGSGFDSVLETIIREGVSEEELREILPDIIKQVARTRVAAPFMAPRPVVRIPAPVPAPAVTRPAAPAPYTPRVPVLIEAGGGLLTAARPVTVEEPKKEYPATVRPAPVVVKTTPMVNSTPELLPKAKPVNTYGGSQKVKAYHSTRLDEIYHVGGGKYKKLSEMNREDIRFYVRMLEGKVKALEGSIKGWNKILDQLLSYKVNVVQELPDSVKEKI